jgi:hypothetical protein
METLGKFIVYGNQLLKQPSSTQFWLIWNRRPLYDKYGSNFPSEPDFIKSQRLISRSFFQFAKQVIIESLHNRIYLYDFELGDPISKSRLIPSNDW